MTRHERALAARRAALLARSERLRFELAADAAALGVRFRLADHVFAAARSGATRLLLVGAAALIVLGRPRRVLRSALRLITLWPIVRPLLPHLGRLLRRRDETSA